MAVFSFLWPVEAGLCIIPCGIAVDRIKSRENREKRGLPVFAIPVGGPISLLRAKRKRLCELLQGNMHKVVMELKKIANCTEKDV